MTVDVITNPTLLTFCSPLQMKVTEIVLTIRPKTFISRNNRH